MSKFKYSPVLYPPYRVSSYFWKRKDVGFHIGLDLHPTGNHDRVLHFPSTGRILREGYHPKSGWFHWVELDYIDNRKWKLLMAHMAHRSPLRAGNRFDVGQWAGTVGKTGYATGLHVHIEMIPDFGPPGMRVDPLLGLDNWQLVAKAKERGY